MLTSFSSPVSLVRCARTSSTDTVQSSMIKMRPYDHRADLLVSSLSHSFLAALNLLHSHSPCPTDNPSKRCPCIVHTTFSGQLRSQVRCGRCGHQSETFEPFLDLSLDVRDRVLGKDHKRIEECLNRYTEVSPVISNRKREEKLTAFNLHESSFTTAEKLPAQYDCAACGKPPEQASKRLSIKALPQVLCVQLKVRCFLPRCLFPSAAR